MHIGCLTESEGRRATSKWDVWTAKLTAVFFHILSFLSTIAPLTLFKAAKPTGLGKTDLLAFADFLWLLF